MRAILKYRVLFIMVLVLVGVSSNAFALTVLTGSEASQYLGDLKARLLRGKYTYEILGRNHRDAMYGRFSDGLIFNTQGGNFLYLRRQDGDHLVVIDAPNGREEDPVTEDSWRQKIQNTLSDDNNIPYVFLNDQKDEIAVLFVGKGTRVTYQTNSQGLLEISLKVDSIGGMRGRRRSRGPF